jgi:hypothetical protein
MLLTGCSNNHVVPRTQEYFISGTLSGLTPGAQLTVTDNSDGDSVTLTANGPFSLSAPITPNSSYQLIVATQPVGETCSIANASGNGMTGNVTVNITCSVNMPTVSSISPNSGSIAGGTTVTVMGTNFVSGDTTVTVDTTTIPSGSVTVNSSTWLTFATPAHAAGNVALSVTAPGGTSADFPGGFTYTSPDPTVSCSANPSTVRPGDSSTITATGVSPGNLPLTYSYSASAGSISGNSATATLSTVGVAPGTITVICNVADNQGNTASANTTVTVSAPPPPP